MAYPNLNEFSWYLTALLIFSSLSFIIFGLSSLFAPYMVTEFERYGLKKFRVSNGYLQLLGAIGLGLAFYFRTVGLAASAGLAILMVLGFIVRLRIKDGFVKSFPAFFYAVLNAFIYFLLLKT